MKRLYSLLLLVSVALSTPLASADFFDEQIVGADTEVALIQDIRINNVSLRDKKEVKRHDSVAYFVTSIKEEAVKRFNDGTIPVYRRYDIITSLKSFTDTMNQYFMYRKMYEQTKRPEYAQSARDSLEETK